jgi:predicted amidophosphoribosyltransferase
MRELTINITCPECQTRIYLILGSSMHNCPRCDADVSEITPAAGSLWAATLHRKIIRGQYNPIGKEII